MRLQTPTQTLPVSPSKWESQTHSNAQQTVQESNSINGRISKHQVSSSTSIIEAVNRLAKGAQSMAQSLTMMSEQIRTLQDANVALAKGRRAKRTRLQLRGALSIENSQVLVE